ncbi:MAG: GFA family protein [Sphingobium sp.]
MVGGTITGSCLCGACSYSTDAEPIDIRACHCKLCQKATGAPFYARVKVPLDAVDMTGPTGWHHSSPELARGFCTACGTSLYSKRAEANQIGLCMGSLDDPDRFHPSDHIWISSKQAWLTLADDIPCYAEGPPV